MSKTSGFLLRLSAVPAAYLAWTQLAWRFAKSTAPEIELSADPCSEACSRLSTATTPVAVKPKGEWMFDDLVRFANRYGVPFTI